jgi:hypothetical protein
MATVFVAHEIQHNRQVALKVLHPELTHSIAAERFVREIKTAAKLTHPNILPLLDSGSAADLLYYVTPYVPGQTLRACLQKQAPLPLADALSITQQIADALSYAHEQGVVHRDIKPENILLTAGHQVWVADFGLAHALTSGDDAQLTATGISIGSPLYMSPEQVSGSRRIDGRADIYALGCVLFETLTGVTPFIGDDIPAVLAKHLTLAPPRVTELNKQVPAYLDTVVGKALEKSPTRRFSNASQFRDALLAQPRRQLSAAQRGGIIAAVLATLALALVLFRSPQSGQGWAGIGPVFGRDPLDTTRYVVLPFESGASNDIEAQQRMYDALRQWRGIDVVDLMTVQEALRNEDDRLTLNDARRMARRIGAGRLVRGQISQVGGRYRLAGAVYNVDDARVVDNAIVTEARAATPLDTLYSLLADSLMTDARGFSARMPAPRGTTSRPARDAYLRGYRALLEWEVAQADSLFNLAVEFDPDYAQAYLWLGQLRGWLSQNPPQWQLLAERALAGRAVLPPREQKLSEALHALATQDFPRACAIYDSLAQSNQHDFAAVYGTADCRRRDRLVLRDKGSVSGWRFRANYYRAILAYQRAFQIWPTTHKAYRANAFTRLRGLLFTRTSQMTAGRSISGEQFLGAAMIERDTIVFIPYAAHAISKSSIRTAPEAVARLRNVFHDVARDWVDAYPRSAAALEALALATDLRGDPHALDLLRRARAQTDDAKERAHLGALQVVLGVKRALPRDRAALRELSALADSLVRENAADDNWSDFAPAVAMVAGEPDYAARAARAGAELTTLTLLPVQVWSDAQALLVYSALGVRPDSIRIMEERIRSHIERSAQNDLGLAYQLTLVRPASMAFRVVRLPTLQSEHVTDDHLIRAEVAFARGDKRSVRAALDSIVQGRVGINPANLQLDAIYPEAWLLHAIGDARAAAAWMDPSLKALAEQDPTAFEDFARMGALLRLTELRARAAAAAGDALQARTWATALYWLWRDADGMLQPIVNDMRAYSSARLK